MIPRAQFDAELLPKMISLGYENHDNGFFTALEIIEQMPPGTRIQFDLSVWECLFPVAQMQEDFRYDVCPHKAAALAYIAWKKGLE